MITTLSGLARENEPFLIRVPAFSYDWAVFGDGPAACTFALVMARRGKKILIVPARTKAVRKPWGETLAPRGEFLLRQLDVAKHCLEGQFWTDKIFSCWKTAEPESVDLAFEPHGRVWHLARPRFDQVMLRRAAAEGAEILDTDNYRFMGLRRDRGTKWTLDLAMRGFERTIHVGYVLDATGRSSYVSRLMGVATNLSGSVDRCLDHL